MKNKNSKPITPKDLKQIGKNTADKLHNIKCQAKGVKK